jgi:sulfite reductase alpha subunit-like flavoprotein
MARRRATHRLGGQAGASKRATYSTAAWVGHDHNPISRRNLTQSAYVAAQDVAERVAREARLLLFAPSVMPMDAYPLQHLPDEKFVVLVTATTGQVSCC